MTIFTIDGILHNVAGTMDWALRGPPGFTRLMTLSYLKWLYTQTNDEQLEPQYEHWETSRPLNYDLDAVEELFQCRVLGNTCLSALRERATGDQYTSLTNNSKGCCGVMRVAPIGLYMHHDNYGAYRHAGEAAGITHRNTTSDQSSGVFASIVSLITHGKSLRQAVRQTLSILKKESSSGGETETALTWALKFADNKTMSIHQAINELGDGWLGSRRP